MKHTFTTFIVIALATLSSAGCAPTDSPAYAARTWINSMMQKNGSEFTRRTCSVFRGPIEGSLKIDSKDEAMRPIAVLMLTLGMSPTHDKCPGFTDGAKSIRYDTSMLKVDVLSEEGDKAQVKVGGQLVLNCQTSNITVDSMQWDTQTWQMVKEERIWKWCGAK